jgi:predicted small lipoprotein YifL
VNRAKIIRTSCALGALVISSLALSGCGRRGDLEAPAGSTAPVAQTKVDPLADSRTRIDASAPPTRANVVPPRQPFILDSIL